MIPHPNSIKENCIGCQKSIMLHNKIITCSSCDEIAHAKCAKSIFEYNHLENSWICFECGINKVKRYNIFSTSSFDKHDPHSLHHIEDLHELSKIDANYLHINLKKSKYILFRSNRARVEDIPLYYDNFQLERVTSTKFLGIVISDTLVWDEHIRLITRRLSKISGSLFKLARCLPKEMRRTIYFALVNSQIMYGISVWGSDGSLSNLSTLFAAQKKAIRTLFNIPRISRHCPGHTKGCINENKILTVHNLYFASVLNNLFLTLYSNPPKPIINQIKPHLSIRNDNYFILPKLKLTTLQKNLPYIGLKIWNCFINISSTTDSLDKTMVMYWKYNAFKKFTKSFFFHVQKFGSVTLWELMNLNLFDVETKVLTGAIKWGSID